MGNCKSKVAHVIGTSPQHTILCNKDGNIIGITESLLKRLRYNAKTLEGQFIGILMSDFMSMLHKKYFIHAYHASQGVERNKIENKLKALHAKRPLIIYDIHRMAHIVHVRIEPNDTYFIVWIEFVEETEKLFYSDITEKPNELFKLNKSDAIIVKTDFVKSTELLHEKGVPALIDTSIKFHTILKNLIRTKYYPFVYLHEVIGDSFVLVLNTDWTYNSEKLCATLAVNFVFDLVQQTRNFVEIRTGIAYGQLYYGFMGSFFHFFGFPMNMAARLENKCAVNEINMCQNFHKKLVSELDMLKIEKRICSKRRDSMKGFGEVEYYSIPVSVDTPFINYSES